MVETPSGEQKTTGKTAIQLSDAVRIVNAAIQSEEDRLKRIAESECQEPIMLEGRTTSCYYVQLMIDPAKVAPIMLDYRYPIYMVLEEDAPQGMWDELARLVGLDEVLAVDI